MSAAPWAPFSLPQKISIWKWEGSKKVAPQLTYHAQTTDAIVMNILWTGLDTFTWYFYWLKLLVKFQR